MNCIFFLFFVCLFAAAEFIGAGLNGMAFFSTKGTSTEKFVMKQTKEGGALTEYDHLLSLHLADVPGVVLPKDHFNGPCVQKTGRGVTFAVCLYLSIVSL